MKTRSKIEALYSKLADLVESSDAVRLEVNDMGSAAIVAENCEATSDLLSLLSDIEELHDNFDLTVENPTGSNILESIQLGSKFNFKIDIIRNSAYFLGKDLDDLLTTQGGKFCISPPKVLCLINDKWRSWEDDESIYLQSAAVNAYLRITEFIRLLKEDVADHENGSSLYLFTNEGKVDVPLTYSAAQIYKQPDIILDNLFSLLAQFKGDHHKDDKAKLIKHVIKDKVCNHEKGERMDVLLRDIEEVVRNYHHNHELFISGFSFESKKEDLLAATTDFTGKLNGVIDSIHARIIGIPIATAIPAIYIRWLKQDSDMGIELAWLVFLGALFVVIAIGASLFNQWRLLLKVRDQYRLKWARFKTEIPNLTDELKQEYDNLEGCFKLNRGLLIFFSIALAVFAMIPIEFMFSITEPLLKFSKIIWLVIQSLSLIAL